MKRREFLRNTGWFVVGASLVGIPACGDNNNVPPDSGGPEPAGTYRFPQGVASGDPRAASVMLWTRAVKATDPAAWVIMRVQVSSQASFGSLVVDQEVSAAPEADHTVRVLITGLSAGTTYYYRFVAGSDSITGRTRTAAAPTADAQVNLAWVSCQDYTAGHYGAYRQMIVDDDARPEADKIHVVVHLGDMIYETRADGFQAAIDENFERITLTNRDGQPRAIAAFPSGGGTRAEINFARSVDDYRHLYKTFFSDPDIQAARARWPFVCIWDDHEFTDDCWQSQANYTDAATADEGDQTRRVAASQAWFEYIPAHLTGAGGVTGVPSEAKDFAPATVTDAAFVAPNADNFVAEPNNVAAVGAITIYRSLRFGRHVELVMTDERSYRSDHAITEDFVAAAGPPTFFTARNVLPQLIVDQLDQGMTANGGNPLPAFQFPPDNRVVANPRTTSPVGTMLGKQQKAWWKATMKGSDATWKLWGNEVTLMRLRVPALQPGDRDRVLTGDSWDGYATERNELMTYLRTENIKNVVVLTGDIHAAFAGVVMDNYDAATPAAVATELVGPGVASNSLFSFFEAASRGGPGAALRPLAVVDASQKDGPKFTENLNMLMRHGTLSAVTFSEAIKMPGVTFAQALGLATAEGTSNPNTNSHLRYIDTNSQGYCYAKVTGEKVEASIVTIKRPVAAPTDAGPGILRTAKFTIPKDNPGGMTRDEVTGTAPFPPE